MFNFCLFFDEKRNKMSVEKFEWQFIAILSIQGHTVVVALGTESIEDVNEL